MTVMLATTIPKMKLHISELMGLYMVHAVKPIRAMSIENTSPGTHPAKPSNLDLRVICTIDAVEPSPGVIVFAMLGR